MIKIIKGDIPDMLKLTFRKGKEYVFEYLRNQNEIRQPEFTVRGAGTPLHQDFNEKCAFCESKTKSVEPLKYHHYRPSYNATAEDNSISKKHYVWLMYEWDNLFLVCNTCAKNKANNFPILGGGERYTINEFEPEKNEFSRVKLHELEYPLILDPCYYDPEEWFYYSKDGSVHTLLVKDEFGIDRSDYTIKCFDLNREQLVNARRKKIEWINKLIEGAKQIYELSAFGTDKEEQIINSILNEGKEEYCGVLRFFIKLKIVADKTFKNWLITKRIITRERAVETSSFFELNSLLKTQNLEKSEILLRSQSLGQIRINEIRIRGFRAIKKELIIHFPNTSSSKENWLVLIGENGSGKSTVLQAVYACIAVDRCNITEEDFEDDGLIYIGTDDGHISLGKNKETGTLAAAKVIDNTPILGYGSIRMSQGDFDNSSVDLNKVSGSNLVNPLKLLINTNEWIKERLSKGDFENNTIKESLLKLVGRDNTSDIKLIDGSPHIVSNIDREQKFEYKTLSTGFKQLLTIACDIIYSLNVKYNDIQSARGIVFIDELENHLHPKWKTRIVGQLREIFPLVQFIVATHEPLCINNLDDGEVIQMKRLDNGSIESKVMQIPVGTRSNQILTGEWFGLTSTLDEGTLKLMEEHRELIYSKVKDIGEFDSEELVNLENQIDSRLVNSVDRTLFGIFKEEYYNIISESDKYIDSNSEEFRELVKRKLKDKFNK